jgi:predicted transcriptional regulator YdeE
MKLVDFGEMIVAGVCVQGTWESLWQEVPKAWRHVFERAEQLETVRVGPYLDVCLGANDGNYLQLVGVPVRNCEAIQGGFTAVRIPAQRLLHQTHVGPLRDIAKSFGDMYAWAGRHGLKLGEFKLDFGYTRAGDEAKHELYVGLLPEATWHFIEAD